MISYRVAVIGIGSGVPGHLTGDGAAAMRAADVFLVADKRSETADLVQLRADLCAAVIDHDRYRFVALPDPARSDDGDYAEAVDDWHRRRAAAQAAALRTELPDGGRVGLLVWGDPSLYDSTLRQLERIRVAGLDLEVTVFPGVSSPSLLAAAHRIVLNRVGGAVHVTTGRRLVATYDPALGDVVVMLDGGLACAELADAYPGLEIFWGANLGLPDQALISGRLAEVLPELRATRQRVRAARGWVMDTYLLRHP